MSFESDLTRLDEIVGELEHDDLELARALELFAEAVDVLRTAAEALNAAEAEVKLLVERTDALFDLERARA
ncbi:MAG: hypothetical protein NVS9B3_13440 [Gemmatimonadaceae bacterium]